MYNDTMKKKRTIKIKYVLVDDELIFNKEWYKLSQEQQDEIVSDLSYKYGGATLNVWNEFNWDNEKNNKYDYILEGK